MARIEKFGGARHGKHVATFGEPCVDRSDELVRFATPAAMAHHPRKRHSSPNRKERAPLLFCDRQRLSKGTVRGIGVPECHQHFALQPMQIGEPPSLSAAFHISERFFDFRKSLLDLAGHEASIAEYAAFGRQRDPRADRPMDVQSFANLRQPVGRVTQMRSCPAAKHIAPRQPVRELLFRRDRKACVGPPCRFAEIHLGEDD